MNNQKIRAQLLPYFVAILSFLAVSGFYFAPQFEGKSLKMHDITQYEGMSHDIDNHKATYGEDPQWTGNLFSGMPAYLISIKFDSVILKKASRLFDTLGQPASYIFIAMLGFFVMLCLWGLNPWVGIVPALAYGLSTYFFIIIGAGHITKMIALAYAPLMLGSVFYAFRRNMWVGAALAAFFASLEISASHPQITYYFIMVLLAYWINEGVKAFKNKALPHFARVTGLLAIAAVLAVGSNLAPLWYINQHTKDTIRGGTELSQSGSESQKASVSGGLDLDYATAWSYGRTESFNMFIPNLMGGASDGGFASDGEVASSLGKYNARAMATQLPAYWGDQPMTAGPTYLGAVAIFLCLLGLFLLRGRAKWWIVSITAVALMLSWGRNFMWFTELFFNYFPGYNKFRTVSMILVIAQWSVPFLGALALNKLWKGNFSREQLMKALKGSVIITGGVALLFAILGGAFFSFGSGADAQLPADVVDAMKSERLSMLRGDSFRSLIFVILGAGVVAMYGWQRIKRGAMIALLAVLICADLVPVNMRFMSQDRFIPTHQTKMKPTAADLEIMEDTTLGYRVINLSLSPFNDATTSYFHRSVGGYHGAKLQRYQDVIDRHLSKMNMEVYNMLNTKYLIVPNEQTRQTQVQLNANANGAAWFVSKVEMVDTPDQEINSLSEIDTKTTAVVDSRFSQALSGIDVARMAVDTTAEIRLTEYYPNRVVYDYSAAEEGVAVFSEIYYDKGWLAYIDGHPAEYFRADYILRAMVLPAGSHKVEFRFRAPGFDLLSNITLIFSLLIIAGVVAVIVATLLCNRKKRQNGTGQQQEA